MTNAVRDIPLADLSRDPRLQMRVEMSEEHAVELAEHFDDLPPAKVMLDTDGHYWLTDGWHQMEAAKLKGLTTIRCLVEEGEFREAIFAAAGANHAHGLRRTNADKRKAVETLLNYLRELGENWSNRAIADTCKVGHPLVGEVRRQLEEIPPETNEASTNSENGQASPAPTKRIGADGKSYSANKRERDLRCDRCKRLKIFDADNCPACKAIKARYIANCTFRYLLTISPLIVA